MKRILITLVLVPLMGQTQTITSIASGNASNPLIWDCTCFPTTSSDIVINHTVNLDVNWAITSSGSITVNSGGKLLQSGLRDLLIDGSGSQYLNNGQSAINRIAVTNGGTITNNQNFSVTEGLYVGVNSNYANSGLMDGLDSLMTEGSSVNNGTIYTGNFLNTGTFSNTGHIAADSMGNTGTFNSTGGYLTATAFGNSGTFNMTNQGWLEASENWWNIGDFTLGSGLQIYAGDNFYNGDTLGGSASLVNNGVIEVVNNFYNGWDLSGSGQICIGQESYNAGAITGTLDICDNTGTDFDFNVGTIAGTIVHCQPGCFVGVEEKEVKTTIYPNPSDHFITIESTVVFDRYILSTLTGQIVHSGELDEFIIDIRTYEKGIYLLQLFKADYTQNHTLIIE